MSTLSKQLIGNYFRVMLLSLFTFIALLVVARLEAIAHFATMGAPLGTIIRFALYQIPYVIPVALPLSSLLSALLLFSGMSQMHTLTALRSCGYSITQILAPLVFASALLFCCSFYICSEVATKAHLKARQMVHDFGSINPLILLQNARVAKLQGAYVSMEPIKVGESARDLIVAGILKKRLFLYTAQELNLKNREVKAENVSLFATRPKEIGIENLQEMKTDSSSFSHILRPKGWKISADHLDFKFLKARRNQLKKNSSGKAKRNLTKCHSEVVRRFSYSFATLTFTLAGALLGMQLGREQKRKNLLFVCLLVALALICFFVAHEVDHLFWLASLLLLTPHLLLIGTTLYAFYRLQRGRE